MNCAEAEYLAPLYWSNELDAHAMAELELHLKSCASCAQELQLQKSYDEMLRRAFEEQSVDTRPLLARVRRDQAAARPFWQRVFGSASTRLALVAALLVVVIGGALLMRNQRYAAQHSLYADAADDHNVEVVQHAQQEWLYGAAQVEALVQQTVGERGLAQALAPPGYHIDRARICELLARNYVHIVYRDGTHEISFFLRRRDGEALTGRAVAAVNGCLLHADAVDRLQVAGFQSQKLTILVVSDLSREQTLDFVRGAAARV